MLKVTLKVLNKFPFKTKKNTTLAHWCHLTNVCKHINTLNKEDSQIVNTVVKIDRFQLAIRI